MEQTIKTEEVGTKSFGLSFLVTVFAVLKIFFIQRKKLKKGHYAQRNQSKSLWSQS